MLVVADRELDYFTISTYISDLYFSMTNGIPHGNACTFRSQNVTIILLFAIHVLDYSLLALLAPYTHLHVDGPEYFYSF